MNYEVIQYYCKISIKEHKNYITVRLVIKEHKYNTTIGLVI